jgi:hypothetical protein
VPIDVINPNQTRLRLNPFPPRCKLLSHDSAMEIEFPPSKKNLGQNWTIKLFNDPPALIIPTLYDTLKFIAHSGQTSAEL